MGVETHSPTRGSWTLLLTTPRINNNDTDNNNNNNNNNKSVTSSSSSSSSSSHPKKPKMKEFWVEVMAPVPSSQRGDYGRRVNNNTAASKKTPSTKKRPRSKGGSKQQQRKLQEKEIWHLAKPMTRKGLAVNSKVLVMIPAIVTSNEGGPNNNNNNNNTNQQPTNNNGPCESTDLPIATDIQTTSHIVNNIKPCLSTECHCRSTGAIVRLLRLIVESGYILCGNYGIW